MNKRVLIITYYWPPAGGGGVQRWLKFAKYLPQFGYTPIIFTPENADYPVLDESLLSEVPEEAMVVRHPIWEPYRAFRSLASGGDKGVSAGFIRHKKKEGLTTKIAQWVRGNMIIPDARRFWVSPSVDFLQRWLEANPVDVIVSTGPPHSMHLIARKLCKLTGIPWLADFRDPWVNMDNVEKFKMTPTARSLHARLERKVLCDANAVVTVSWHLSAEYEKIRGRTVGVITNGFDHTDFTQLTATASSSFVIGHYGTFGEDRNPRTLWNVLDEMVRENASFARDLKLELIGPTDISVLEAAQKTAFRDSIEYVPYMKHDEALQRMKSASVLTVILNQNANEEGRVTGKIFEYVACEIPVLGIGSVTSDCARVINDTGVGRMIAFDDATAMKKYLLDVYEKKFKLESNAHSRAMKYSRKELTRNLADQFNQLLQGNN